MKITRVRGKKGYEQLEVRPFLVLFFGVLLHTSPLVIMLSLEDARDSKEPSF